MTTLAVIFLLLDGILLGWVGIAFRRFPLLVLSALFFLATATVLWYFRRHLRNIAELGEAKLRLQSEMEVILAASRVVGDASSKFDSPVDQ